MGLSHFGVDRSRIQGYSTAVMKMDLPLTILRVWENRIEV